MPPIASFTRRIRLAPVRMIRALLAPALIAPILITSATPALAGTILPVSALPRVIFAPILGLPSGDKGEGLAPDRLSLALGVAISPDYEGSDHHSPSPAAGALGRWHGHAIAWRGNTLAVDLVPEYNSQRFKLIFAPQLGVNSYLVALPHDPVVARLRKHRLAAEGGAIIGFSTTGVFLPELDQLTVQVAAMHDLGSVHGSYIITPSAAYATPLSKTLLATASASFDIVGAGYAQSYFGIDGPAQAASGLPLYSPGSGIKSTSLTLGVVKSLEGNVRQGWAIGLLGTYERLLGPFARSPLVGQRGNANQFSTAVGLTYTF